MFTIISYYTDEYEEDAKELAETVAKFGYDTSHIQHRESKNSWELNCQQKATFIKEKLQELDTPIVWLDADARLNKELKLFEEAPKFFIDLAVHFKGTRLLSGTLYLDNKPATHQLVDEWIEAHQNDEKVWDQVSLQKVLNTTDLNLKVGRLPIGYCQKFDDPVPPIEDATVIHTQASRRLKNQIT